MKKTLVILVAALVAVVNASAIPGPHVVFGDFTGFVAANTSQSGAFNLAAAIPAYNPGTEEITGATVSFVLQDLSAGGLGQETVTIDLEGNFFGSAQNFSIVGLAGVVNLNLLNDNVLTYNVVSGPGSVVGTLVASAVLQFDSALKTQSVPDGGSMMALLGLSVLGLGWAGRRVRA